MLTKSAHNTNVMLVLPVGRVSLSVCLFVCLFNSHCVPVG